MRFEKMGYPDKRKRLRQIQVRLNNGLFGGELCLIPVSVENVSKEVYAGYGKPCDIYPVGKIMIDHDYIDDIVSKAPTIKSQTYLLSVILLHEMIHQYCNDHGIDDSDHGTAWRKTAKDHGLESIYENGDLVSESMNFNGLWAIRNL